MRYSPLAQINRENVATLKVAWTFHVGDISDGSGGKKRSGLETTPILVDGTLYLTSGFNRVFALDPETGKQRWVYDPMIEIAGDYGDGLINRGVAAWLDPAPSERETLPQANFRSYPGCAAHRAGRRDGRAVPGLRQPRTNQPARCPALHSRAISHDFSAGGDRRCRRGGLGH